MDACTLFLVVSEKETHREDKGSSVPERSPSAHLYLKGRCSLAHQLDRVNFYYRNNCGKGAVKIEML